MSAFDLIQKNIDAAIATEQFEQAVVLIVDSIPEHPQQAAREFFTSVLRNPGISLSDALKSTLKTKSNDHLIAVAEVFLDAERPDEAKWISNEVLQKDPDHQKALVMMADIYSDYSDEPDKAVENFDKCIDIEKQKSQRPDYIANRYADKARVYLDKKDNPEEAATQCRLGIAANPGNFYCNYNLALALKEQGKFQEANDTLNAVLKQFNDVSEKAELLYLLGELNDLLYKPHKARDYFIEVLKCDSKMVYAYHNLATVCRSIGEFNRAVYYTKNALSLYQSEYLNGAFGKKNDKYYFYAEMIRDYKPVKTEKDYALWEDLLRQYLGMASDDPDGHGEMFKMFLRKKKAIENGEIFSGAWQGEWVGHLEDCQSSVIEWYNNAVDAFTSYIATAKKTNDLVYHHNQLGYIYLAFEMYDKAKEKFQSILTLDPDHARANEGMGVTLFKAGEFAEATEFFKKAARLHPGSMNLECNLADSYRAGGQLNEAECIYRRVLNKSPKYLDALIGMGESSKAWGDKEVETGNSEDAAEYFEKAISYFQQVQDMRYAENSSKQLTRQEHDALSYSLGYSKVRLYEARKGLNLGLLLGARKSLKSVGKTAPEYLKSQKAIRLINQKLLSYSSVINIAPIIIFILSFLLLAMAQYFTFTEPRKVYTLNREAIMSMAFKQQADTADLSKALSPFLLEQFAKPADIKKKLSATVSESVLERLDLSMIKEKEVERIKFNDVSYATITVGAIVLMIASLFLPNLTKLKIGAVEMEKNAVDTVKATTAIIKKD